MELTNRQARDGLLFDRWDGKRYAEWTLVIYSQKHPVGPIRLGQPMSFDEFIDYVEGRTGYKLQDIQQVYPFEEE